MPPSTCSTVPVVDAARGDARDTMAVATSSARTSRPRGWRSRSAAAAASRSSAASSKRPTQGVSAVPGATASPDTLVDVVGGHGQGQGEDRSLARAVERSLSHAYKGDG